MTTRVPEPAEEAPIQFQRPTVKGRGAQLSPGARFERFSREQIDDGWGGADAPDDGVAAGALSGEAAGAAAGEGEAGRVPEAPRPATTVTAQPARSIITRNASPDVPFTQSVNPYYGCEHGCVYCYARPSYAYWGLSPGLDFETRLFAKTNAAELLRAELAKPGYRCETLAIGVNTDAYQPIEREWKITRALLEVCAEFNQPVGLITKSALVERDIDILAPMAARGLAKVYVSVPTFDAETARLIEPRAAAPHRRIAAIRALSAAGIPVGVTIAPVIPVVNDSGMEAALAAAREAGATEAAYIVLRLPHELKDIFRDWLARHMPGKAAHAMSLIRQMRGGEDNDARFGARMKGEGLFAELLAQRFAKACARLGFNERHFDLDSTRFCVPAAAVRPARRGGSRGGADGGPQMTLF